MYKRIGYHRISDDSVTSFSVPESGVEAVINGIKQSWDIDKIWTRDVDGIVDWQFYKNEGKLDGV